MHSGLPYHSVRSIDGKTCGKLHVETNIFYYHFLDAVGYVTGRFSNRVEVDVTHIRASYDGPCAATDNGELDVPAPAVLSVDLLRCPYWAADPQAPHVDLTVAERQPAVWGLKPDVTCEECVADRNDVDSYAGFVGATDMDRDALRTLLVLRGDLE